MVTKFCMLGADNKQIADFLEVSLSSIDYWLANSKAFSSAVKKGKIVADAEMVNSLYQRGKGYSHPEDKHFQYEGNIITVPTTKHYPPDTAAAFIWLKNRRPKEWKNQPEVIHHEHIVKELQVVSASDYKGMEVVKKTA